MHELVFECRIDSDRPARLGGLRVPGRDPQPQPGPHTFEIRAIDLLGAGLRRLDAGEAHLDLRSRCRPDDPPEVILDIVPPAETWLLDVIFTFHANEPDVTFECKVDLLGLRAVRLRDARST